MISPWLIGFNQPLTFVTDIFYWYIQCNNIIQVCSILYYHYSLFLIHYSDIALKVSFNWLEEKQLLFLAHESSCHYLWSVLGHIKTWNFHIKAIFVSDISICTLSFSATIYTNGDTHWRRVESVWCCLFIWKGPVMFWIVLLGIAATTFIFMFLLYCKTDMFNRFLQLLKHIFDYQSHLLAMLDFTFSSLIIIQISTQL